MPSIEQRTRFNAISTGSYTGIAGDVAAREKRLANLNKLAEKNRKYRKGRLTAHEHLEYHGVGIGFEFTVDGVTSVIKSFIASKTRYAITGSHRSIGSFYLLQQFLGNRTIECPYDCPFRTEE